MGYKIRVERYEWSHVYAPPTINIGSEHHVCLLIRPHGAEVSVDYQRNNWKKTSSGGLSHRIATIASSSITINIVPATTHMRVVGFVGATDAIEHVISLCPIGPPGIVQDDGNERLVIREHVALSGEQDTLFGWQGFEG